MYPGGGATGRSTTLTGSEWSGEPTFPILEEFRSLVNATRKERTPSVVKDITSVVEEGSMLTPHGAKVVDIQTELSPSDRLVVILEDDVEALIVEICGIECRTQPPKGRRISLLSVGIMPDGSRVCVEEIACLLLLGELRLFSNLPSNLPSPFSPSFSSSILLRFYKYLVMIHYL